MGSISNTHSFCHKKKEGMIMIRIYLMYNEAFQKCAANISTEKKGMQLETQGTLDIPQYSPFDYKLINKSQGRATRCVERQ